MSEIVRARGYETIHLLEEMFAEFEYRPVACKKSYRMIVVRKRMGIDKNRKDGLGSSASSAHREKTGVAVRVLSARIP